MSHKFLIVGIFIIGITTFIFSNKILFSQNKPPSPTPFIDKASKEIFKDDRALYSYVKEYGPKQTISQLNQLSLEFGSCHDVAHKAGRFSYEIYKDNAFKECGAECHSGCYHGATEAYFKENGTVNLQQNLRTLCSSELNPFFSHQCLHGIGHGLMAWTGYELFEALKNCELLNQGQESCFTGVFMENIVGGLTDKKSGHYTKYLNEDPQYPCTLVDERYGSSCYLLQTSRMMQLFLGDFTKVAAACLQAPQVYQIICFESMGRDVGGTHRNNPQGAISVCSNAPLGSFRTACLRGTVQDSFWDPRGADTALNFCQLLSDSRERDACYVTIFVRAQDVLATKQEKINFCSKAQSYRNQCLSYFRL